MLFPFIMDSDRLSFYLHRFPRLTKFEKTKVMKREILFKAKRVDNGEWVEGLPCYLTEYAKDFHEVDGIQCDKTREYYDVNPETVCQFTGLLDKNGNKIFEWDKLKRLNGKIDIVVFDTGQFVIEHESGDTDYIAVKNNFEITGNIHDK